MEYKDSQQLFQSFQRDWPMEASYYIWGTSNTAHKLYNLFPNELNIVGFIDNNAAKWGTQFLGHPVFSPEEFFSSQNRKKLIVASQAYNDIRCELERKGLLENTDFCDSRFFIGIYQWLQNGRVYLRRVDLSITSYCNLRCRHCNMLMPYYKKHRHYDLSNILLDVDVYFRWVDYVEFFNILGGEPFLHPDILEITREIAKRYREKIGDLVFFSNGTIMPEEQMLDLMKEYRIKVYIGDYREHIAAIRPKVDEFIHKLKSYGIPYEMPISDTWTDFNHAPTDRSNWTAEQLAKICNRCGEPFRGIHNQKFYFCHLNTSAALSGQYEEEEGDYLDLSSLPEGRGDTLVAFDLACIPKGYVSYCRYCGGCAPMNQQEVPPAEQLPAGYQGRP
ncbi:MAG: radical SAM protein [Oscillospiraceae bacterium]|nr:radical SAM protein [Oscillospiraceae bacterium]